MAAGGDVTDRLSHAGQAVGAIAIAFTLYMSLQQLAEQRRAVKLNRLADLRSEYARLLGAAHEVVRAWRPPPLFNGLARTPTQIAEEEAANSAWQHAEDCEIEARAKLYRLSVQLELQDRNLQRRDIVSEMHDCLKLRHHTFVVVADIRSSMLRLRDFGRSHGASPAAESRIERSEQTDELLALDAMKVREFSERVEDHQVARLRRDAMSYVRFALGASFSAEEAGPE